jgi:indolepyruvate ferredoxin oxidoreductase beta subunit
MQTKPITIAIMALGGQGGGTLADWLIEVAERSGYLAQGTSVPGVAQRTGATIYYLELFPETAIKTAGREPVLALMPVPGNVDVVVAAELMEAGRAMVRGFVTPDRTALVASTHRIYAIGEKAAMGDGRAKSADVLEAAQARAKTTIMFDMDALAQRTGSIISAVLLGAVAGSGVLPFPRAAYEGVLAAEVRARDTNLAAFAAGFDGASQAAPNAATVASLATTPAPAAAASPAGQALLDRANGFCPPEAMEIVANGLKKVVDYQDPAYGSLYLDRLEPVVAFDRQLGGARLGWELSRETARYLALWMTFEDVFRVADLKTRGSRFDRVRDEVRAAPNQIVGISEFIHPRIEEVCDALPAGLGKYILTSPALCGVLGRFFHHGRRVSTTRLRGFVMLYTLARLGRFRRHSLRFKTESARIETWLANVLEAARESYDLGVEIACCQRLVKGYGSTHARGFANFEAVMAVYRQVRGRADAPRVIRTVRDAALGDEEGRALREVLGGLGLQA